MTKYFTMHLDNPQPRLIKQAVAILNAGEVIAYPTDSGYALGCSLNSKKALETIRKLRDLDEKHPLTLLCHSIAQVSQYCFVNNEVFRILKRYTPGPYTFILPATKLVPKPAQGIKRKVVGIRILQHPVVDAMLSEMTAPMLSTSLWLAKDETPITDPTLIAPRTGGAVGLILDTGIMGDLPSTVIDLLNDKPVIIRKGLGDPSPFE
ncbi:MAG: threonylcarbamoyl-AMP synthase [Proteobacteria bacterium]|nr:threonylcarbamoyl-AMP synthase [Pseudomonadota bacterium]